MSQGLYTLSYFNVPGRGESIRVMLAIGGIKFENNFVPLPLPLENPENQNPPPFDDGTWGELKPILHGELCQHSSCPLAKSLVNKEQFLDIWVN